MRSGSAQVTDPAEWYVERGGQPLGPYTLEQVHEGLLSGEFAAKDRVSARSLGGRFLTVKEASEAFQRRTATGSIHLPPRPSAEITGFIQRDEVPRPPDAADPAASLYELVQTIREKKPSPKSAPLAEVRGAPERDTFHVPSQVWLIASLTLVLGASVWALTALINRAHQPSAVATPTSPSSTTTSRPNTTTPVATTPSTPIGGVVTRPTTPTPVAAPTAAARRTLSNPFANPAAALNTPRTPPPPPPTDRDRERERAEKERDDKEREERDREDQQWWRARDDHNQPIARDRFGDEERTDEPAPQRRWTPGQEVGAPNLRQAPDGAPPPGRDERDAGQNR